MFCFQADICKTSNAKVPDVYLYPPFDKIENGECPTFSDLLKFDKLKFDKQYIFREYFNIYESKDKNELDSSDSVSQIGEKADAYLDNNSDIVFDSVEDGKIETILSSTKDDTKTAKQSTCPQSEFEKLKQNSPPPPLMIPTNTPPIRPPPGFESKKSSIHNITPNVPLNPMFTPNFPKPQTSVASSNLAMIENLNHYLNDITKIAKICIQNTATNNILHEIQKSHLSPLEQQIYMWNNQLLNNVTVADQSSTLDSK